MAAMRQGCSIRRLAVFGSATVPLSSTPRAAIADSLVKFAQGAQPDLPTVDGARAALEKLRGQSGLMGWRAPSGNTDQAQAGP